MPRKSSAKPRPPIFRALGHQDPPSVVQLLGQDFYLEEIYKHDSWAATAIYSGHTSKAICKFNRMQPVFGLSLAWLGRQLAANERNALERLRDVPNVPKSLGDVCVAGEVWRNAIAREYIPGHPLARNERVNGQFFPALFQTLTTMHQRGLAYIDMHKRENIIVGDDGKPYLIDFQIGMDRTRRRLAWIPGLGFLFDLFCRSDMYHLNKHVLKHDPNLTVEAELIIRKTRPWWIKAHRMVAVPFRSLRRRLLVATKVRSGKGQVETEVFAENALREAKSDPAFLQKVA